MEMLPQSEQQFAFEFIKRMVLAWDPDYTKATPDETIAMDIAVKAFENNDTVNMDSINWD